MDLDEENEDIDKPEETSSFPFKKKGTSFGFPFQKEDGSPHENEEKKPKRMFKINKIPGDRFSIRASADVVDKNGIKADAVASEILELYKVASEQNDAKFFDAVIKAVATLTGVPQGKLIDPEDYKRVAEDFRRNAQIVNESLFGKRAELKKTSSDVPTITPGVTQTDEKGKEYKEVSSAEIRPGLASPIS